MDDVMKGKSGSGREVLHSGLSKSTFDHPLPVDHVHGHNTSTSMGAKASICRTPVPPVEPKLREFASKETHEDMPTGPMTAHRLERKAKTAAKF